jgi:hypothetical protein
LWTTTGGIMSEGHLFYEGEEEEEEEEEEEAG